MPVTAPNTMTLEEAVRPFGVRSNGLTFLEGRADATFCSYDDLAGRIAGAATRYREAGVETGGAVAMNITNEPSSVIAALGVWATGATLVSLPPMPRQRRDRYVAELSPILNGLACEHVVGAGLASPERTVLDETWLTTGACGPALDVEASIPNTALVQFTSGTTGTPKAVRLSGAKVAGHALVIQQALQIDPNRDRGLSWLPLYHDMGLIGFLLTPLFARASQWLAKPTSFALHPASWLETVSRLEATITAAPGFALRMATRSLTEGTGSLGSLRACLCGAERISWETFERFAEATSSRGLRWESLLPVYGLAEATLGVTFTTLDVGPRKGRHGIVSVGKPLPGVRLQLAGAPPQPGRISISGPSVFDGYQTPTGMAPAGEWFDTADLGFIEDEELFVVGRSDETIQSDVGIICAEDVEAVALREGRDRVEGAAACRVGDSMSLMVEVHRRSTDDLRQLATSLQLAVERQYGIRVGPVLVMKQWAIPRTTSGKPRRDECRELVSRLNSRTEKAVLAVLD